MNTLAIIAVASTGFLAAACNHMPGDRVATGALVGGAAGAGIGAAATGTTGGTIAGGILGAGTGAMIGAASENRYCTTYDRYGNPYRYRC
jgi:osmotically inducible lipoprotein OsmB